MCSGQGKLHCGLIAVAGPWSRLRTPSGSPGRAFLRLDSDIFMPSPAPHPVCLGPPPYRRTDAGSRSLAGPCPGWGFETSDRRPPSWTLKIFRLAKADVSGRGSRGLEHGPRDLGIPGLDLENFRPRHGCGDSVPTERTWARHRGASLGPAGPPRRGPGEYHPVRFHAYS